MLDDMVGNYGGRLLVAAGGVGLALLALIGVLWLVRNRAPSPFVRGGKNRQPRLQVLDAAAVDARRRLVLVRRDGVEHLIMIGGPTDIVIESGIGDTSRVSPPQAVPLESLSAIEARAPQRLEPVREAPRVISRQPEPEKQNPPQPSRSALEAPPAPEKRELPRPAAAALPIAPPAPATAAVTATAAAPERLQPVAITPTPTAAPAPRPPEPAPVPERKEVADAVDILEAARQRVMPPQVEEPQKISDKEPSPLAVPPQSPMLAQDAYREAVFEADNPEPGDLPAIQAPKSLDNDFESILEAEMSNNLKAERIVPLTPAVASRPSSPERREPEMAAVRTGDEALQNEVARIFGEISVKGER